jgi:hypothetical protein
MKWLRGVRSHFDGRLELAPQELVTEFHLGLEISQTALMKCLSVFFDAYVIRPGWLRAADPIDLFTQPPSANPLAWLWVRFAYEDRLNQLNHHLHTMRDERGFTGRVSGSFYRRGICSALPWNVIQSIAGP